LYPLYVTMQATTNKIIGTIVHSKWIFKMLYVKLTFTVRSDEPIAEMIKPAQRIQIEARNKLHPMMTLIITFLLISYSFCNFFSLYASIYITTLTQPRKEILTMHKKIIISTFLASTLLFPASLSTIQAAPSSTVSTTYQFFYDSPSDGSITGDTLTKKGTTFVDIRALGIQSGLEFAWSDGGTRASLNGFMKKMAVRIGSKTAMLDGKSVTLSAAPFKVQGKQKDDVAVYVPIRFAVQVMNGDQIATDLVHHQIKTQHIDSFSVVTDVYKGSTYTLKKDGGDLYVAHGKQTPVKLVSLGINFDAVDMEFESTAGRLLILTINDTYGEPHIHNQQVKLIFQKGKLIRKVYTDFTTINDSDISTYQGKIVLSDGKVLRMIEDGTGNIVDQLDLVKLGGGSNEKYAVEGLYDDAIIMRTASKGRLLLIDRNTNQSVTLYKELLDASWQKQIGEDVDIDSFGSGDYLQLDKRVNHTFYFTFRAGSNQEKHFTYTLKS